MVETRRYAKLRQTSVHRQTRVWAATAIAVVPISAASVDVVDAGKLVYD